MTFEVKNPILVTRKLAEVGWMEQCLKQKISWERQVEGNYGKTWFYYGPNDPYPAADRPHLEYRDYRPWVGDFCRGGEWVSPERTGIGDTLPVVGEFDPTGSVYRDPGVGGRLSLGGCWRDPDDRHAGIQPDPLYRYRADPGAAGSLSPDPDFDPGDPVPGLLGKRKGLN